MASLAERVKEDFAPVAHVALGVLLFGSAATGRHHARSDVDVCLVAGPGRTPDDVLGVAWRMAHLREEYDIKVFEELPLYLKGEVLDNGLLLHARDTRALWNYLYPYVRLWADERRARLTHDDVERILEARRRAHG